MCFDDDYELNGEYCSSCGIDVKQNAFGEFFALIVSLSWQMTILIQMYKIDFFLNKKGRFCIHQNYCPKEDQLFWPLPIAFLVMGQDG